MNAVRNSSPVAVSARQYLTFMLAGEEYGIDILAVQELRGWEATTPVHGGAACVLGMISLRGVAISIIDLRARFGLAHQPCGPTTVVMIIRPDGQDGMIGVVVDAVSEVYDISAQDIQARPDIEAALSSNVIAGIATVDQHIITLLDASRLIGAPASAPACARAGAQPEQRQAA